MEDKIMVALKRRVRLKNLPNGKLFHYNGTLALKSEYRTTSGTIEAYIIDSGEAFWGGTDNGKKQGELLVNPIEIINQ